MERSGAWRTNGWSSRAVPIATWRAMTRRFVAMWRCYRQRNELLELDDRLLRDIGITRDAARLEARKRWWQ